MTDGANGLWFMTGHVAIKLAKADNSDGISILEHLCAVDFGPPLHVHRDEDETFYILAGDFRFQLADSVRTAGPGDTIMLPKGVPHAFRVISPEGGRFLTITRGGFEAMVRAASRPAPSVGLPEQTPPTPEQQAALARLCLDNGIELIGPPID